MPPGSVKGTVLETDDLDGDVAVLTASCRRPRLAPDQVDQEAEVDVFIAIASPVRRALLDTLSAGPRPVRDLAAEFSISRPAVSQHLRILKEASLVSEERFGRERRYQLNPSPLRKVGRWLTHYEGFWRDRLTALRDVLEDEP